MTPQQASPPVTVRGAETGEAETVGRLVAEAFQDDEPSTTWIFPDPQARARRLPRLFTALARHRYLPRGRVDVALVDGVVVGTAMWAPPGLRGDSLSQTLRMLPDIVGAMGGRLLHGMYEEHLAVRSRGPAPHWYLADLAVSDAHRGLGIGGELLRRVLDDADRPALLECKDDNVPYYQRFGFEVVDRFTLPGFGRTAEQALNTMRRDAVRAEPVVGSGAGGQPRRRGKVLRRGLWLVLVVAVGRFLPGGGVWLAVYVLVSVSALFAFLHALIPAAPTVLQPGGSQVVLHAPGDRPLQVIKEIRELLDVEASTAQRWVEEAPTRLGPPLDLEQAEAFASRLRRAGASADALENGEHQEVTRR